MSLRLAVDARDIALDAQGIGRYVRAILRRIAREPDVELTLLAFGPFPGRNRRAFNVALGTDRFRIASRPRGCDVIWHPWNGTFFPSNVPSVVSMHDAMPFVYPEQDSKRREHQQAPFRRSVATASRFITVSAFAREEISGVFGLSPDRFTVIHHGVEPSFRPAVAGAESSARPYLLFVGNSAQEPPKNFPMLYEAFLRAFPKLDVVLAVAGPTDPALPGTRHAGLFRGDATGSGENGLRELYQQALALCLPSYHETFGMPMLEAMACGTPVLAARATALPEVGADAAYYAPPHDSVAWADAMQEIAANAATRARLREAGIERARSFTWERSASAHLEVFRSC